MAKNTNKDPRQTDTANDIPDTDNWDRVQTQFPPYWVPEKGAKFYAKFMGQDESDPEFQRFVFQALADVKCFRGPRNNSVEALVKKGELFTASPHATLRIDGCVGAEMVVTCTGKIDANTPAGFVWGYDVKISPESSKMLADRKARNVLPAALQD